MGHQQGWIYLMGGLKVIHVWGLPFPLLWDWENVEALINLRQVENDDMAAIQVRSIRNFQILASVPTIIVFVAVCDAKALI